MVQPGAINSYDSVFATSIGGYPKGAVVLGSDAQTRYISTTDNNLTNPNTGGAGWTNLSTAYWQEAILSGISRLTALLIQLKLT
jgi:hypothetical protein